MTKNEQIAKHMGWNYKLPETKYRFESDAMGIAKLIQAQLVKEEWRITIVAFPNGTFEVSALQYDSPDTFVLSGEPNEPAAIVELACKIWRIK